jgi:hypothetical protein
MVQEADTMETAIGKVTHFYNQICVAVLQLNKELRVGDIIHFVGHTTDFEQRVDSLEIEHHKVEAGTVGSEVALKVEQEVRKGDTIFKVSEG